MGAVPAKRVTAVVSLVEDMLRKGYRPKDGSRTEKSAVSAAGRLLELRGECSPGNGRHFVRLCLEKAEAEGSGPDWKIRAEQKLTRERKTAAAKIVEGEPRGRSGYAGKIVRVCVIPDVHLSPEMPPDRMAWLGKWCAEEAPDEIVQLGDLGTFDSVSGHAPPGTLSFEGLPRVRHDFEAVARGLEIFGNALGKCRARKTVTLGNHEYRLARFEDRNPQIEGMLTEKLDDMLAGFGWASKPFREYLMIAGAGFIHIPINSAGKPYGGKMSAHAIARDALHSIIHGHTHVRQSTHVPKLGHSKLVSVISPGCALPPGHVEHYAKHSATGWFWGALCISVRDGVILDENHVSMETLQRRYRGTRKGPSLAR
jgi:hypothetical protein